MEGPRSMFGLWIIRCGSGVTVPPTCVGLWCALFPQGIPIIRKNDESWDGSLQKILDNSSKIGYFSGTYVCLKPLIQNSASEAGCGCRFFSMVDVL